MIVGFGAMSMLQAVSHNFGTMFVVRFLLGAFEAGYAPGVAFYLSWFYGREEMALRYGIFLGASALGNAVASSLAYAILSPSTRISGWRLLFILGKCCWSAGLYLLTSKRGIANPPRGCGDLLHNTFGAWSCFFVQRTR